MKKILIILLCAGAFYSCETIMLCCDTGPGSIPYCLENPESEDCFETNALIAVGKAWIYGNESWEDPIGAQFGIESITHRFNESSSIRSGLGVSLQGAGYKEPEYSGKVSLSYFNVPVLYNYRSKRGWYGEIGLQPGLLLRARDKVDGGESWSYKDYVKKIELGLPIGGGYWLNDKLSLGARATFGLTNLDNSGSEIQDHNVLITAVASYRINWAKWIQK